MHCLERLVEHNPLRQGGVEEYGLFLTLYWDYERFKDCSYSESLVKGPDEYPKVR